MNVLLGRLISSDLTGKFVIKCVCDAARFAWSMDSPGYVAIVWNLKIKDIIIALFDSSLLGNNK